MKRKFEIVESQSSTYGARSQGKPKRKVVSRPTTGALLSRSLPFPISKKTTMLYTYGYAVTASAALDYFSVAPNDMYDFDRTTLGKLGNKQPLFFDAMLSSTGPYKQYYVSKWKTTWTILNETARPVRAFAIGAIAVATEFDSLAEAENFPGAVIKDLTSMGGSQDMASITVSGSVADVYGSSKKDLNFVGTYGSSPTTPIYGALVLASGDGTTSLTCYVSVRHEFEVELTSADAIVS